MGRLTVEGMDALSGDFAALAAIPDKVVEDILNAEADIIAEEQRKTAREMGVYDTGLTADSITKTKVKKTASGRSMEITFKGTRKRGRTTTRNAEIAFVNEYGKKGQRARPFIDTANKRKEAEAVEAGEKVYHAFLDSKNL